MKKCPKCGENKDLDSFGPDKRSPDGKTYVCKECRNLIQREFGQTLRGRYLSYKKGARERGFIFTITVDEFKALWNKNCFYCGDKIEGIGLDRKDNSVGYEIKNVVPCCVACNTMKMTETYESFINRCKKIVEIHNKKLS
jgi:hypothetical protein